MPPKRQKSNTTRPVATVADVSPTSQLQPLPPALQFQLEQQKARRCDYVFVKVPPQGAIEGAAQPKPMICPFRLNHHAFMQMSFSALRERCVAHRRPEDVAALHCFLTRYLIAMATYEARRRGKESVAASNGRGRGCGRGRCAPRSSRPSALSEASRDQDEAVPPAMAAAAVPLMTAEELRVQLRAEYGVDVKDVVTARGANTTSALAAGRSLMPHELTEEEFLEQISRPSSMAQECCIQ